MDISETTVQSSALILHLVCFVGKPVIVANQNVTERLVVTVMRE